jgi:hypothetical protein
MRTSRLTITAVAAAIFAAGMSGTSALGVTGTINPQTNIVQLDSTDSVPLTTVSGSVKVSMSGNGSFGSAPGEVWNAGVVAYLDASGNMQYAVMPNNGSVTVNGSAYKNAMISDTGDITNNTGSTLMTESNASDVTITSGTISGNATPLPGPAEVDSTTGIVFAQTGQDQPWLVTATGAAFFDSTHQYDSVVIQYRDPTQGIVYGVVPIGGSAVFTGFNFRAFLTDDTGALSDNSGSVTVSVVAAPEPASLGVLGICATGLLLRRPRK